MNDQMKKVTINCQGQLLYLNESIIMGILNATPDSFYDGGKYANEEEISNQVKNMLDEGASIIDIGSYSSRSGAAHISEEEELKRAMPVIKTIHSQFPQAILSVDTFRSSVASKAIESGACIINDISGGTLDTKMVEMIAYYNVPYVLMHMKGNPQTMKNESNYKNMMDEIMFYFSKKINALRLKGVKDIIIDPGFGFSKSLDQNYELLHKLSDFKLFELPILVGVSRKSMINKLLNIKPREALNGTTVLHTLAVLNGASILRVHDVKEAKEVLKIVKAFQQA